MILIRSSPPQWVHVHLLGWEPGIRGLDPSGMLLDEEKTLHAGLGTPDAREEFLLSRWMRRSLASGLLGQEPAEVGFATDSRGKPSLVGSAWYFSQSHTQGRIALAFSRSPVGIDIEKGSEVRKDTQAWVARRWFSPQERGSLERAGDSMAFLRLFTRKEARAKALGQGWTQELGRSTVPGDPGPVCQDGWHYVTREWAGSVWSCVTTGEEGHSPHPVVKTWTVAEFLDVSGARASGVGARMHGSGTALSDPLSIL